MLISRVGKRNKQRGMAVCNLQLITLQLMHKTIDKQHQSINAISEFSDEQFLRPQLKLPKIDRGKYSAVSIDKYATPSQSMQEPQLPRIAKHQRQTSTSGMMGSYPDARMQDREGLPDPRQTLSSRGGAKQQVIEGRRQTQANQPDGRAAEYEQDFQPEGATEGQKDSFVKEVEDRLRSMSDQYAAQQQKPQKQQENNAESDMSDFQQKVLENRQLLKKGMLKKKESIPKKEQPNKKPQKKRNQSLYEKRVREYKESTENKYLKQKKKEVAMRELKEKLKQERQHSSKDGQTRQRRRTPVRSKSKGTLGPASPSLQPLLPAKQLLKPTAIRHQDANAQLFQEIHTILQNPHKSRSEFLSLNKVKGASKAPIQKTIVELTQKVKQFELKSGKTPTDGNMSVEVTMVKKPGETAFLDWHRISINPKRDIECLQTNFNQEVERIGVYIQRNQQSIENFVKNRELLMELELQQRLKQLGGLRVAADGESRRNSDVQVV